MGRLQIQIPDLLRTEPTDQDSRQLRDTFIDLGAGSFLRLVCGKSVTAASLPGYHNLSLLLQNPYTDKWVVKSRQDMFHEIFQKSLEDMLDNNAAKLSFCSSPIRKYPNESNSQYLMREETELRERIEKFKTAIESLKSMLQDAESEGLRQIHKFAVEIWYSEEYQEMEQRLREYMQASRKYNSFFASWIFAGRFKSKHEPILREKEERFSFLRQRVKLKDLEDQIKPYTIVVRFFRKLSKDGINVCLPKLLNSSERSANINGAVNPVLAVVKGDETIPNDARYSPDRNIFVITGPNNGGKTTFARTVGLLCLLAHAGFYVSAKSAEISLLDGIFTHFVRSDDLVKGAGRYAVELRKVKGIFEKATPASLVVLDEPCSGTSHQEGLEQSMILLRAFHKLGCAVYFVTHMHEIAQRIEASSLYAAGNLSVGISFDNGKPVLDYKIREGAGKKSYGIELAEAMGLGAEQLDGLIRSRIENGELPAEIIRRESDGCEF